jgi:mRNA interferase MazF
MERGDIYLGVPPDDDPRRQRVYVIVSRAELIASRYSTVICAPVYSNRTGVPTEVSLGPEHGLKNDSAMRCDELTSVRKSRLVRFVGHIPTAKIQEVDQALVTALAISLAGA